MNKSFTVEISKLDSFLYSNKSPIRNFLIYGQDEGGVILTVKKILGLALKNSENIANSLQRYNYQEVIANPYILNDFFQSVSLFSSKEIMIIDECIETINKDIINTLMKYNALSNNIVFFIAGELKKSSKIVKAFELLDRSLIIPCYKLDHYNAIAFISNWLKSKKIAFDNEAASRLALLLPHDRLLITNELEKLALYAGNSITLSDIEEVFHYYDQEASIDLLCQALCDQNKKTVISHFDHLINNDYNYMMILRSIQNYMHRLLQVKAFMMEGQNIEEAVAKLNPPIFFKQKSSFIANIKKISLDQLKKYFDSILSVEIEMKRNNVNCTQSLLGHLLYNMTDL